ncbi:MAG: ParA family protein [Proteobacteria bacterium]|nr:ParA family protein [Pseudomonadota bacterium]
MKSLVVASQKGGVGKTTVSLHLAHALAARGYNTLLVDCDPQGAIGLSLSRKLTRRAGFKEYIDGNEPLPQLIINTRVPGFHLLPFGHIAPTDTERFSSILATGDQYRRLLYDADQLGHDLVIVDTPCGFGGITTGILRVATHMLSPIQAEPIALRSVTQLLEVVQSLRRQGAEVELVGFLISMLQLRQTESYSVAQEVWEKFPPDLLFTANVPRDPVFLEAVGAGVPLGMLRQPPPPVAHVFDLVAAELEGRMGLLQTRQTDGPQPLLD